MTMLTTTDVRALSDRELDSVNGGKVTEIGIGPLDDPAQSRQRLLGGLVGQGIRRRRLQEVIRTAPN